MTDERYEYLKEYLQEMKPFNGPEDIHNVPVMRSKEDYQEYVVKNFIRCGAIPKDKLEIGKVYIGECRNSNEATWLGDKFEYMRYKFGKSFNETINHFEDDDGYDVFVPLKLKCKI